MSDVIVTKHRTIMTYEVDHIADNFVLFQAERDEDDDRPVEESCIINRDTWVEMGAPNTITVSVEPGDLLNEPPS